MTAIDNHRFYIATKQLELEAVSSAKARAAQLALESMPSWKISMLSRRVSKEAFELFERRIKEAFPSETYSTLIFLTLQARETLFFGSLPESILSIISGNPEQAK